MDDVGLHDVGPVEFVPSILSTLDASLSRASHQTKLSINVGRFFGGCHVVPGLVSVYGCNRTEAPHHAFRCEGLVQVVFHEAAVTAGEMAKRETKERREGAIASKF